MLNVINYIGKWSANAKTAYQIASEMSVDAWHLVKHEHVRKAIKAERHHWIIWNNKWNYIADDQQEIKEFVNKRVKPAMYGFIKWMNNLTEKLWEETNLVLNIK